MSDTSSSEDGDNWDDAGLNAGSSGADVAEGEDFDETDDQAALEQAGVVHGPEDRVSAGVAGGDEGRCVRFDARFGEAPAGVLPIFRDGVAEPDSGPAMELVQEADTASFMRVRPGAFLRLDTSAIGTESPSIETWTLTMDVRVHALPEQPMPLLQCTSDPMGALEQSEAYLYPTGAVGVFNTVGDDPAAMVQPGKWTRLTLRFGADGGRRRALSVFVNGRKAVSVHRGVMDATAGRFSLPPDGFLLLAGGDADEARGAPGVDLRFVELRARGLADSEVRSVQLASVYSQWKAEADRADATMAAALSLAPLYKRPPPAWREGVFAAEFGDAVLPGVGAACAHFPSLRCFAHVARRALDEQAAALDVLSPAELAAARGVMDALDESVSLARAYELSQKNAGRLWPFLRKWRARLEASGVGTTLLVPVTLATDKAFHPFFLVLERTDADAWRVSVVNATESALAYHASSPTSAPPKIQTRLSMTFSGVSHARMCDDGWWFLVWRLAHSPDPANTPDKFYDDLLPLLLDRPLEAALAESGALADDRLAPLRTNPRARVPAYRAAREAWVLLLSARGVSPRSTLALWLAYQQQWLRLVLHDLDLVPSIDESDARLVRLAVEQMAHVVTRRAAPAADAPLRLQAPTLAAVRDTLTGVERAVAAKPLRAFGPPATRTLDLRAPGVGAVDPEKDLEHDLTDRLPRVEDVSGLAGPTVQQPGFVPIDMLLVPARAMTMDEGIDALRWADKLCTLLSMQHRRVKLPAFHKVALLQHLFTRTLPVPAPGAADCIWAPPVRYALQLDVLLLLKRLMEHFLSSAFAVRTTREFDAVKLVVSQAALALADAFFRKRATDIPSEASTAWRDGRFGVSPSPFDGQSETISVSVPELNVTRTAVLDYWRDVGAEHPVMPWNESMRCDRGTAALVQAVCAEMAFPASAEAIPLYVTGEQWPLVKNFPEFEYFRDVVFFAKYLLGTDPRAFPPVAPWTQKHADPMWQWNAQEGTFVVRLFGRPVTCVAARLRYPSYAIAGRFTGRQAAHTEDDLLHIRDLPDFDGQLSQRDSELLLSALTVPYLRIPLVVSFFATEDRVHALRSPTLRQLLDSVVFEPARFLPKGAGAAPEFVPAKDEQRLATPYGLLLNELALSPRQVTDATLSLLKLGLALDTGSYFASQATIILYLLRFATRVESFVEFLLAHARGDRDRAFILRDTHLAPEAVAELKRARTALRAHIEHRYFPMLQRWIMECHRRAKHLVDSGQHRPDAEPTQQQPAPEAPDAWVQGLGGMGGRFGGRMGGRMGRHPGQGEEGLTFQEVEKTRREEDKHDYDALFHITADLRAHIVLGLRNCRPQEWTARKVARFLSLFAFLTARHTWNAALLSLPEPELFEVYQHCRRTLVDRLARMPQPDLRDCMETVVAVVSDADKALLPRGWGAFAGGSRQRGRFLAIESSAHCIQADAARPDRPLPVAAEADTAAHLGVEVSVQCGQLTLQSSHLQALGQPYSADEDVVSVFGRRSLQCAIVEEAQHRTWIRLVGRGHDLQCWDADDRQQVPELDRMYDPSECPPTERWIAALFEPIRLANYVPPQSPPIEFFLREAVHGPDDDVVRMIGAHPETGGGLIDVILCKSLGSVQIFLLLSHGRRWWRQQVYALDARFSLGFFQPSGEDRVAMWRPGARYEAGRACLPEQAPSVVITREATDTWNLAGTEEMLVPRRFLCGVLPQALVDAHEWWMDDNDALRGYSDDRDVATGLPTHVVLATIDRATGRASAARRSLRGVREAWTAEDVAALARAAEESEEETGLHGMRGMRKRPLRASRDLDRGVYDDAAELVLLDALHAAPGSRLRAVARCLATAEPLSHVLFWQRAASAGEDAVHRVELPRLRFTLTERAGRLVSVDHADLALVGDAYLAARPEVRRLVRGLPHALVLANSNDEPRVFLPLVRPVRPEIQQAPFSTELVLDRTAWQELPTPYLLLPVHVSLSFLVLPTLSAALYLLLLRYLHRDYTAVQRLVPSVGTDAALADDEAAVLAAVAAVADSHPNAHAVRLHLSLALADAPVAVRALLRWDVPAEAAAYLGKLAHVAMPSVLDRDVERAIVLAARRQIRQEDAVRPLLKALSQEELSSYFAFLSSDDFRIGAAPQLIERFEALSESLIAAAEEATGLGAAVVLHDDLLRLAASALSAPRGPLLRFTLQNRDAWLAAPLDAGQSAQFAVFDRQRASGWQWRLNPAAAAATPASWQQLSVTYAQQRALSGNALRHLVSGFFAALRNGGETLRGQRLNFGFLGLYEMFTGTTRVRAGAHDDSFTIARVLAHYLAASSPDDPLASTLSVLSVKPHLIPAMPRYKDTRQRRGHELYGAPSQNHPVCPLGDLLSGITEVMRSADLSPPLDLDALPSTPPLERDALRVAVESLPDDRRTLRRPGASDAMLGAAVFRAVDLDVLAELAQRADADAGVDPEAGASAAPAPAYDPAVFAVDADALARFAGQPLSCIGLDTFVTDGDAPTPPPAEMPFDVTRHPEAGSVVARETTKRLQDDLQNHVNNVAASRPKRLVVDVLDVEESREHKDALLQRLEAALEARRASDLAFVQAGFGAVRAWANAVPVRGGADGEDGDASEGRALDFSLLRTAGAEAWLGTEAVICSLLSTQADHDLSKVNPFLSPRLAAELRALAVLALAHGSRVGQANRALTASRKLRRLVAELHKEGEDGGAGLRIRMQQQLGKLTQNLTARREYCDSDTLEFDPRFLVFEFIQNMVLFKPQVEMVKEFKSTLDGGGSMVRQLIMGSGKTTVVSPMLCLMMGDRKHLVVEVVPPALLEFARQVLRSTFSSVLQKRVYTFSFDRSTTLTGATLKKLRAARADAGVVVTTPTSVKALMLRYIENLTMMRDRTTTASLASDRRYERFLANQGNLMAALRMFTDTGVLLCDEIDMLLHPLRSELNFPVGPKHDLDFAPQRWDYPMFLLNCIQAANRIAVDTTFTTADLEIVVPLAKESQRVRDILKGLASDIGAGYKSRALQRVPHLVLLDDEFYASKLCPRVTDLTVCWLEQQHFDTSILGGTPIRVALGNKQLVATPPESRTLKRVPSALSDVGGAMGRHFKQLNMCADWLKSFLPHVLRKIDRVTFGVMTNEDKRRAQEADPFMPRTRWKLAIPFVSKDVPSRSSEFAHPDVVIALTFLGYRYEGLRMEDFTEIVSALRVQLAKEVGPMKERPAAKLYATWVHQLGLTLKGEDSATEAATTQEPEVEAGEFGARGGAALDDDEAADQNEREVVPLWMLKRSDDEQMEKLFNALRLSPSVIQYYLKEIVFPTFMRHQQVKLSASGQEIGGDILFPRRVGFSGTPSALLPREMGETQYEKGSDGLMLTAMCDPSVVSFELANDGWGVKSILRRIANEPEATRFSALLDTGALITGMSNEEVAAFLLDEGLSWCDGVVFLDEEDRKMVLVRDTRRVVELEQCGILATRLFALYDQIHTTGTDLPFLSSFNARAVQTVGKDMVWRDYVQGAWRMRQLGRGHTIRLLLIPEVFELIQRELAAAQTGDLLPPWDEAMSASAACIAARPHAACTPGEQSAWTRVLRSVAAWLVINSMRSERVQSQQLLMQNAANVWRKNAFRLLLRRPLSGTVEGEANEGKANEGEDAAAVSADDVAVSTSTVIPPAPAMERQASVLTRVAEVDSVLSGLGAEAALDSFLESINFSLDVTVAEARDLEAVIAEAADRNAASIVSAEDAQVIADIRALARAAGADRGGSAAAEVALTAEIVQEQEQEQEQEEEQEQEREVEIEKYVDLQYSREEEAPQHWRFDDVVSRPPCDDAADVDPEARPLYTLRRFQLYKRRPVPVPEYVSLSANYFNPRWTGERRLKNVVCVLEYVPNRGMLRAVSHGDTVRSMGLDGLGVGDAGGPGAGGAGRPPPRMVRQLSTGTESTLARAFSLLDVSGMGIVPPEMLGHVLHALTDEVADEAEVARVAAAVGAAPAGLSLDGLRALMLGDTLRREEDGRYYVALSLAEAETVRRVMHLRGSGPAAEMRLRILPLGLAVIDRADSTGPLYSGPAAAASIATEAATEYQTGAARQILRFFDGELSYSDHDVGVLLRALQAAPCQQRQLFFRYVSGCRRRLRRKWQETPLAKVFTLRTEFHLLFQRAAVARLRLAIAQRSLSLFDAFQCFDGSKRGVLTPGEVWGALAWLGIDVEAADVVDVVRACDLDGDGNLGWGDFSAMLRAHDEDLRRADERVVGACEGLDIVAVDVDDVAVEARGDDEIADVWRALEAEEAEAAAEEEEAVAEEEEVRKAEMEAEEAARDLAAGLGPNPALREGCAEFDFSTGKLPKAGVAAFGVCELSGSKPRGCITVAKKSYVSVPVAALAPQLAAYTIHLEVRLNGLPANEQALLRIAAAGAPRADGGNRAEITVRRDGGVGHGPFIDTSLARMRPNRWHFVTITANLMEGALVIFVDGEVAVSLSPAFVPDLVPGGQFTLGEGSAVHVFDANTEQRMCGGSLRTLTLLDRALDHGGVHDAYMDFRAARSWSCPSCTLVNPDDATNCSMCSFSRPEQSVGGPAATIAPAGAPAGDLHPAVAGVKGIVDGVLPGVDEADIDAAIREVGEDPNAVLAFLVETKFQ